MHVGRIRFASDRTYRLKYRHDIVRFKSTRNVQSSTRKLSYFDVHYSQTRSQQSLCCTVWFLLRACSCTALAQSNKCISSLRTCFWTSIYQDIRIHSPQCHAQKGEMYRNVFVKSGYMGIIGNATLNKPLSIRMGIFHSLNILSTCSVCFMFIHLPSTYLDKGYPILCRISVVCDRIIGPTTL